MIEALRRSRVAVSGERGLGVHAMRPGVALTKRHVGMSPSVFRRRLLRGDAPVLAAAS